MKRQVIPLSEGFFCDGHWYVITSSSLGGSNLTSVELSQKLTQGSNQEIIDLLEKAICFPLFFDGDCALDQAIIIIGDLTEQEREEWIGKLTWKLKIPCGKLVIVCGGANPDDLEDAISGKIPDPNYQNFQVIDLTPGEYLVEIYAYVSSLTVNLYFDENNPHFNKEEPLIDWFNRTRPGLNIPPWLQSFQENGFMDNFNDNLVSYILRLKPLDIELNNPPIVPEIGWCGEFELRRPSLCPLGISRFQVLEG